MSSYCSEMNLKGTFVLICSSACISDLGQAIFYTTTCLLPFLSDDILSTLPYTMISTLATFPPFLHKDIIEYLSTSFLPMAICEYTNCVCVNMRDVYSKQHLSKYFSNHFVLPGEHMAGLIISKH